METVDADEQQIFTIHRHFFGIFIVYIQVLVGILAGLGLIYFLLPSFVEPSNNRAYQIIAMFSVGALVIIALILVVATVIYLQSKLIVTDQNVTQILQRGLFSRKISQLSLNDVEDVTADQHGLFSTAFNFGILKIETAGEQSNFHFSYCPRPSHYAKLILEARERFLHKPGNNNDP